MPNPPFTPLTLSVERLTQIRQLAEVSGAVGISDADALELLEECEAQAQEAASLRQQLEAVCKVRDDQSGTIKDLKQEINYLVEKLHDTASRLSSPEGTRGDKAESRVTDSMRELAKRRGLNPRVWTWEETYDLSPEQTAGLLNELELLREVNARRVVDHLVELCAESSPSSAPAATPAHDTQCEAELTSHGYTPCRCAERAVSPRVSAAMSAPIMSIDEVAYLSGLNEDALMVLTPRAIAKLCDSHEALRAAIDKHGDSRELPEFRPVSAAERPAPTWQPIETCPDDREVLLCNAYGILEIGSPSVNGDMSRWRGWMPLPAPPGPVAQEKK